MDIYFKNLYLCKYICEIMMRKGLIIFDFDGTLHQVNTYFLLIAFH